MGKHAHPVDRPWFWETGFLAFAWKGMDWPAVRRGRQVYTEVFAPCHSLTYGNFLQFQQFMTKEEIKKLASNYEIKDDEPNSDGTDKIRPGKSTDDLPMPYPNANAAKFANGGAEPPDLAQGVMGLEGGENYIFALLTGYGWGNGEIGLPIPPFAASLRPGQFWNPYFPGCIIGMPPPLSDGILDYDDGTPATVSQMSKDVCNFLKWTSEPMYDDKRVIFMKTQATLCIMGLWVFHQQQRIGNVFNYKRASYRYWKKPW
eukprot:189905_1